MSPMMVPATPEEAAPYPQRPIQSSEILQLILDALLSSTYAPVERLVDNITAREAIVADGARATLDIGIGGTPYRISVLDVGPDSPWRTLKKPQSPTEWAEQQGKGG